MLSALILSAFATISSPISISPPALGTSVEPDVELKRAAVFGAKASSVPDEVRESLKLDEGVGAVIDAVFPDSTAEAARFKPGDVLLALDGAKFFIQGIGLASIDKPVGPPGSHKIIVDDFARRGFLTVRVDKPGCGDSEGGPARDVDFDTELDGYRQALKMLKARSDVEAGRIFVFGHSMGGVMAPLLAGEIPVRGIIVYGTIARTWTEYMLENSRRQMELAGSDPSAIDRDLRTEAALATHLFIEKMAPKDIVSSTEASSSPAVQLYAGSTAPDHCTKSPRGAHAPAGPGGTSRTSTRVRGERRLRATLRKAACSPDA